MFVALSTFGAVNGILLTSSRLFYAGACEGQMPEILTMIQIQRFTPTPAVLAMALLSMVYLTVPDIYKLINYVGFATWVRILQFSFSRNFTQLGWTKKLIVNNVPLTAEYWRGGFMLAMAAMDPTEFGATHSSESHLANSLLNCNRLCHRGSDVRKPIWYWHWIAHDSIEYSGLPCIHCLEE